MIHQHSTTAHRFMTVILAALHMQHDDFIQQVAQRTPYETIVYHWIHNLYQKGKSTEEAIQLIYRARHICYLGRTTLWRV